MPVSRIAAKIATCFLLLLRHISMSKALTYQGSLQTQTFQRLCLIPYFTTKGLRVIQTAVGKENRSYFINQLNLINLYQKNDIMPNSLLFDFTVDKASKTIYINKAFAAELSLVWDAFTKQEILDQWWAPKPWVSRTKTMNFEVGGRRFYAMVGPEGQEHWSLEQYTSISPKTNYQMLNAFADADAHPALPGSQWDLTFREEDGITKLSITIFHESLAQMEQMMEMGFQGGITMTLTYLTTLLSDLANQK